MPIIPYSGGSSLEGHFAGVSNHHPHEYLATLFPTHCSFCLCSGRVGVYASTCREWIKSLLFMVRPFMRHPAVDLRDSTFSEEDSDLICQPGIGWMEINETLKEKGIPLFFPVRAKS